MIANKLINNPNYFSNTNRFVSNNYCYNIDTSNVFLLWINNSCTGETVSLNKEISVYHNILNSSKENYKKLYNKQFNFLGYESYLDELKKLPLDKFSKMYLYNDSIRLNINYKSKIFFIEYFKDEKMLIVTSKTDNLKMKETKLGNILSTMESFF